MFETYAVGTQILELSHYNELRPAKSNNKLFATAQIEISSFSSQSDLALHCLPTSHRFHQTTVEQYQVGALNPSNYCRAVSIFAFYCNIFNCLSI